ncbi:Condensin complex subunit 2 [Fulvia fulva]|uniref:Condensin complex subunit 2 n=1 Tax=Passalora fulva TaxID=5499 RepID=A0A9Q8PIS4_PASFU|nr:Condensin complex subunit 2 [Fulvia fulva]KAK4615462.1 Condensin complex subunit 2 [Fulvia fulva]KAK4617259.1 Condensin complex subunit 2 [Fulvia fulva]UJO23177.1 Condensin complex subunit 2 [Fulvia fulva]WPV18979.1 Condensin complex subunit 2 [Fulvia fulva]WPV33681.1 Condensin complex subunit 2 [Fulvia fulva]
MPRVRNNQGQSANSLASSLTSPHKARQIPLNDDKEEKAQRLQSRQAHHSKQMSEIRAAVATPQKKRKSMGLGEDGPSTPSQDDDPYGVRGDHVTPMKRVPILANFEEWMKMATDNKINANNSWNFALIDYFHDMSLLKEGDGVNFQKASCTLDGCVKIYTSRVDSVATETGKLLSGLADSGNKKRKGGDADAEGGEDGEEDEENEDGTTKKSKKKTKRSAEATLVTSFEQLRLKKMELEFSVDPLFKKASADFDEGGAKGLLLNHLSIDSTGRIVFDSSDDAQEELDETRRDSMEPEGEEDGEAKEAESVQEDGPVDIAALGLRFFPDLDVLDEQDICPTLKSFELGGGENAPDLPFLKAPENWRDEHPEADKDEHVDQSGINLNDQTAAFGMDDDDAGGMGFDLGPEVGFGEGGEAWARDAALEPQMRVYDASTGADADDAAGEVGVFDTNGNAFGVTLQHRRNDDQENILNYFDNALQKNWAGPEHWKIARIKEASKETTKKPRKEKEPFEIDFAAPMSQDLASLLYTSATNNSTICLPKKDWKARDRNLLPDDKHFNSKDLLKLFLKPKAKLGARKSSKQTLPANGEVDEAYWAAHNAGPDAPHPMDDDAVQGDYDANFFQDDGLPMAGGAMDDDDDDFADAREAFSPGPDGVDAAGPTGVGIDSVAGPQEPGAGGDAFGANLVAQSRRMRPEYVQYARVAKKVDVRRLKEELWRGIGFEARPEQETPAKRPQIPALAHDINETLRFTDIMNNLQHVYPRQQMSDISTSFGFICLLHLANEKGLVIENVEDWTDLTVRKDFEALELDGNDA